MIRSILFSLSLLFILQIIPAHADITTGLVSWWKFDEGSGSYAYNSSPNANTGTLTGAPTWVTGKRGPYALNFGGDGNYVLVADNDVLDGFTGMTIAFWFYVTNIASEPSLVNKYNDVGNQRGYAVGVNADSSVFFWYSSDGSAGQLGTWKSAAGSISPNVWQHVVGVMDSSTSSVRYYVNGSYVTTTKYNAGPNPTVTFNCTAPLTIGAYVDGTYAINGKIDDVRIYNRALSVSDIREIYVGLKAKFSGGAHLGPGRF